jgi:hypothetical protein
MLKVNDFISCFLIIIKVKPKFASHSFIICPSAFHPSQTLWLSKSFIYELKKKKKLLGGLYAFPSGTMAIGRLDEDSEGLLLLTTDDMSEIIRSKKSRKKNIMFKLVLIRKPSIK